MIGKPLQIKFMQQLLRYSDILGEAMKIGLMMPEILDIIRKIEPM